VNADCKQIQETLLTLDTVGLSSVTSLPAQVQTHIRGCADCRGMLTQLQQLEVATQSLPVPAEASAARVRFEQRFVVRTSQSAPIAIGGSRPDRADREVRTTRGSVLATIHRKYWRTLAIAASILICAGLLIPWVITGTSGQTANAEPLVDRLVDWNVQMAQADNPTQRQQIFNKNVSAFSHEVDGKALSPDERALATKLISSGATLGSADDPITQAEQFEDVAGMLLQRISAASAAGDTKLVRRLSRNYALITGKGLTPKLDRARNTRVTTAEHRLRLQKIIGNNAQLQDRLEQILEQSPDAPRKEVLRELGLAGVHHKGR
jgi:hypothetical protein